MNEQTLVKIEDLLKGSEARGYTYYAIMNVATERWMDREGKFTQVDKHKDATCHCPNRGAARTHATRAGWTIEE